MPPREEPPDVTFGPGGLPLPQAQPQVPMGLTGLPTGGGMNLPAIPGAGMGGSRPPAGWLEGLGRILEGVGSGWAGQPDPAIERRKAQQAEQAMAMQQAEFGLKQQNLLRENIGTLTGAIKTLTDAGLDTPEALTPLFQGLQKHLRGMGIETPPNLASEYAKYPQAALTLLDPEQKIIQQMTPEEQQALRRVNRKSPEQASNIIGRAATRVATHLAATLRQSDPTLAQDPDEALRRVYEDPATGLSGWRKENPALQARPQTPAEAAKKEQYRPAAVAIYNMWKAGTIADPETAAAQLTQHAPGWSTKDFPDLNTFLEEKAKPGGKAAGLTAAAPGGATAGSILAGQEGQEMAAKELAKTQALRLPVAPGGPTVGQVRAGQEGQETEARTVGHARGQLTLEGKAAQFWDAYQSTAGRLQSGLQPPPPGTAPPGVTTLRGASEAAETAGRPIPAEERKGLSLVDEMLDFSRELSKPENWARYKTFFGPVTGRSGQLAEKFWNVDPMGVRLRAMLNSMNNDQVYMKSGMQINESEAKRLATEAPNITLPPENAKARLDVWVNRMAQYAARRKAYQATPAGAVGAPPAPGKPPPAGFREK